MAAIPAAAIDGQEDETASSRSATASGSSAGPTLWERLTKPTNRARTFNLYVFEGFIDVPLLVVSLFFMQSRHVGVQAWWIVLPLIMTQCRSLYALCGTFDCLGSFSRNRAEQEPNASSQIIGFMFPATSVVLAIWYFLGMCVLQAIGVATTFLSVTVTWLVAVNICLCVVYLRAFTSAMKQDERSMQVPAGDMSGRVLRSAAGSGIQDLASPAALSANLPVPACMRGRPHIVRKLNELTLRSFTCGSVAAAASDLSGDAERGEGANEEGVSICVICLHGFLPGEEMRELHCCHSFHAGCFERWLLLGGPAARCPLRCAPPGHFTAPPLAPAVGPAAPPQYRPAPAGRWASEAADAIGTGNQQSQQSTTAFAAAQAAVPMVLASGAGGSAPAAALRPVALPPAPPRTALAAAQEAERRAPPSSAADAGVPSAVAAPPAAAALQGMQPELPRSAPGVLVLQRGQIHPRNVVRL